MAELIDSHCHLDFSQFADDREGVVARAREAGVMRIIAPGLDLDSSEKVVKLAEQFEGVYAAVGVHPNTNVAVGEPELATLRELAGHPKVVAIGEIGLDYYRDRTPHDRQHENFAAQLRLASEVGLPVIIHNREASGDVLDMLSAWRNGANDDLADRPGVLHSFMQERTVAEDALASGFYLGFSGPLTYKKSIMLRQVAASVPADRVLVETDAPFLTPHPLRSHRNEPAYVQHVAEKLAEVRDESMDAIAEQTTANATRLFALDG